MYWSHDLIFITIRNYFDLDRQKSNLFLFGKTYGSYKRERERERARQITCATFHPKYYASAVMVKIYKIKMFWEIKMFSVWFRSIKISILCWHEYKSVFLCFWDGSVLRNKCLYWGVGRTRNNINNYYYHYSRSITSAKI